MLAERPDFATFSATCPLCGLQGGIEVEAFHPLSLLTRIEGPEQLPHLVVREAGEGEIRLSAVEVGQQVGEQLLVPLATDLVQGDVEQLGLLGREVDEDDRDGLVAQLPGSEEPLVAADHHLVIVTGDDWVDEPELPDAAGQRLQFGV